MPRLVRSTLSRWILCSALVVPCSVAHASGNVDARIHALGRRIADHPTDKQLYARRAALLCEQGDVAAAEADLAEIRRIDSGWPEADLVRARCMLSQDRLDEARSSIATYRLRLPDDPEGLLLEADVLFRLERWADAAERYVRFLNLAERPRPEDYLRASEALEKQGGEHMEQASRVLEWGLSKLGDVPALRERSIHLALEADDKEGALIRIDEAMDSKHKGPRQDERWLLMRGDVLCTLSRFDEARSAYRAALKAVDRKPRAKNKDPEIVELRERIEAALTRVTR